MKDQLVPTVVRCRERRQDVAPNEARALSISTRNGTSWSGHGRVSTRSERLIDDGKRRGDRLGV